MKPLGRRQRLNTSKLGAHLRIFKNMPVTFAEDATGEEAKADVLRSRPAPRRTALRRPH